MPSVATLDYRLNVQDSSGIRLSRTLVPPIRWQPGAAVNGKEEDISLTGAAFTALSPPAGAKAVALLLGTATSLVLKGVTGDTGIALTPATNAIGVDCIIPLGASPVLGILNNGGTVTITAIWL